MKNQHSVRSSILLIFTALVLASSLGLLACSNALPDTSFPVSVIWHGGGSAASRTVVFSNALVNSVSIIVYNSSGERIGSGMLVRNPSTSEWGGVINVSEIGVAVFEATVLDSSANVLYVGRATYVVPASGGGVSIGAGEAGFKGGSIQGRILALTTPAMVNTFAGTKGTQGSTPGIGTAALFTNPYGITTDGTNLYITDFASCKISKIVLSTQVVTDFIGHFGVGGRTEGVGAAAFFNTPRGITTDGTSLYVCDYGNNAIRKIDIATVTVGAGFVGTDGAVAGSSEGLGVAAFFSSPSGITYNNGNLYVADTANNKIRQIVISTRMVSTLAGPSGTVGAASFNDGAGVVAEFNGPQGITTDGTYLYVADTGNNKIRKIEIATGVTSTIAGTGVAGFADGNGTVAQFNAPIGITTDGTYLYVTDSVNHNIRKIAIGATAVLSTVSTVAGITPGGTPGTADGAGGVARFNNPIGITTDGMNLYIAEYTNFAIRKIQ